MRWGSWGSVIFETTSSPDKLTSARKYNVVPHHLINRYPAHEFMGEDEHTLNMSWHLNSRFTDPDSMYEQLQSAAQIGTIGALIIGGQQIGQFAIRELKKDLLNTAPTGHTREIKISVTLVEVRP
ncbi:phage tail protein [Pseudoalteromonas luteoviolacea]|uniref:phage tail protein n=1 Tax=Pseudoalteromonas luteoviolacea TaxID=43657 RepID=UPI00115224C0|nr:phage tail protein [Pseudoalteromonas luteoviolacea]TQF71777.1 hypothetical protein FLM44_12140 [Pseudoalteromonas luteoviolacea]